MNVFGPQVSAKTTPQAQAAESFLKSASSSSSAGATTSTGSSTSGASNMDMNAFLRLFTTQLQYQDPTNPLESYELAAQLAQFSSVEKLTQINSNLELEQTLLTSINNAQMVEMLGKEVIGLYDVLQVGGGEISTARFKLGGVAADVTVRIYNDAGEVVRTMTLGPKEAGQHDLAWDGKDDSGNPVPEGSYSFDVAATDVNGSALDVMQTVVGKVFAFRMEEGVPYLILDRSGGLRLPINAVMEVQEDTA